MASSVLPCECFHSQRMVPSVSSFRSAEASLLVAAPVSGKKYNERNSFQLKKVFAFASSTSSLIKDGSFSARNGICGFQSTFLDNSILDLVGRPLPSKLESRKGKGLVQCGMKNVRDLIIGGKIEAYPAKEAGKFVSQNQASSKVLDIRPIWEKERAYIKDSIHVPYFIEDEDTGFLTLLKKQIQFGFGGWWLGQRLTKVNESFLSEVEKVVQDKDTTLVVVCGEGLRSLLACEELYDGGYENLVWLAGGLNSAQNSDFDQVVGETELRFATAGGVQGLLIQVGRQFAEVTNKVGSSQ